MNAHRTGPVLEPYAVSAPEGARPLGVAPFLDPGEVVMWRYRDHAWEPGRPETASPMRVVRDDERGLVAWLAPGTVHLTKRCADGSDLRDVPMGERFLRDARRVQARTRWHGAGILRIAPVGVPWSVWLFWDVPDGIDPADPSGHDAWEFGGWYVNLETTHQRCGAETFTGDHVLDLWIEADGTVNVKDADELVAAVEQGRGTPHQADAIRHNAEHARASFAARDWPFADEWTRWRPDPTWTTPGLRDDERWDVDLVD
ncbi:hypothetical protein ASH01_07860 [Terrabacter sp. Soil811]|uniref:DUF402 domain-containing protein n=1 Tax=Terrabacter sp. Soil811 TaxID=1736419 RepID=UPI0006F5EAAA|nr:DUF402 domain-containing protein [Terrabacter sp. Soil811]KRF45710.1 hypothetical protein ASH01_07860 [Terrabacter sp. Soil811]